VGLESAAGKKLEKMVCKGEPLSTLVNMGGHSALGVVLITRFVAPGHKAPFSLPQSVARLLLAPSCTLMFYSFFLSVV
jgi:hypothetical protein